MKKQKKILISIMLFVSILLSTCQVFAIEFQELEFSESYKQYMSLSDEEKKKVIMPRMYDIPATQYKTTNPLKLAKSSSTSDTTKYSLLNIIPENMVIKNQGKTNSCWTFSSLAVLESTLALKDKLYNNPTKVYDFSERHMEYATTREFLNGQINENGLNRNVGEGGHSGIFIPYLTNGTGPIADSELPFIETEEKTYISEIQNKEVIAQVNDFVQFSANSIAEMKQKMKQHIKNYGAIDAGIHIPTTANDNTYNATTNAFYTSDNSKYGLNHAVAIIGWDDDYAVENFVEGNRPQNKGAWIIKNSWGTGERYTLLQMKTMIFEQRPDICQQNNWTSATAIPDEAAKSIFQQIGFTIEGNEAVLPYKENGFMYISYEDAVLYSQLTGITNAQAEKQYENIYQYDESGGYMSAGLPNAPKIYLAEVFDKKTTGAEYLTQVAINAPETYTCKVYVNPNGTSKAKSDLTHVQLKAGETETFDAGYHTIEFLEPIKITGNNFVIVLEIQGTRTETVRALMEFNSKAYATISPSYAQNYYNPLYDFVEVEEFGKCFMTVPQLFDNNQWYDTANMATLTNNVFPNFDTTIKAFTTSKVLESIQITTPPNKTSYLKGQNFDKTGMVVKAKYGDGKLEEITDYTITNGTNLEVGQTSVTISYNGKTATQQIEVVENKVESIKIKTAPKKTEYMAGEDFNSEGMVVETTYTDKTTKQITDYTITNGNNLKNGQTTVTITYEGKTTTQAITVKPNPIVKIEIKQAPTKVNYVEGQDFDSKGMIVEATYENGMVKQVEDYEIRGGEDLQKDQKTVTIVYEELTTTQAITVVAKTVTSIKVKKMPTKTEYLQNKEELDLTGGIIEITYNDNTKEDMSMESNEITVNGFNNKKVGENTITLTYKGKATQFDVKIKEEAKPENSNFDKMKGSVTRIRSYNFTDANKKSYTILNIELNNIQKATINDKTEYYYYLSSNQKETDIKNWVKIKDLQQSNDKFSFEINTTDISNYEEVSNADVLYLYIKEVATRNDMTKEKITESLVLKNENLNIEEYVDGKKKAETQPGTTTDSTPGEQPDDTLAPGTIPNAGKSALIIALALAIFVIGRMAYLKYKDIQIK